MDDGNEDEDALNSDDDDKLDEELGLDDESDSTSSLESAEAAASNQLLF